MNKILTTCGFAAAGLAIALFSTSNPAESQSAATMGTYAVTVTNLTRGQIFSPALVATHRGNVSMFEAGTAAGTELNSEDCAFIPGPPCGSGGSHDPAAAEGSIYISNGLHGLGGLAPEVYDWRGPVAKVTIVRQ